MHLSSFSGILIKGISQDLEREFPIMDMSTIMLPKIRYFLFNLKFQFRYAKLLDLEYPREKT